MKVLMLAINDPAGTAIQFCRAVNRYFGHSCRLVTLETRYTHSWQKDLHVPDLDADGIEAVGDLLRESDILHFHMTADEDTRFGPYLPADFLARKAVVHHHHGHHDFRSNPDAFRRKYAERGRKNLLVSTPDLLKLLPEARWQPNFVPQDDPLFTPDPERADLSGRLRIAHSPTRKDLKNTDEFLHVAGRLVERGLPLEVDLIDDVPNAECLARKRRCHVLFDHMQGYYGVSSLEGLSQGLAVIAGLDEWNRRHVAEFAGTTDLPWVIARNAGQLEQRLVELDADRSACREAGLAGRRFMETFWSDRRAAARLVEFWEHL